MLIKGLEVRAVGLKKSRERVRSILAKERHGIYEAGADKSVRVSFQGPPAWKFSDSYFSNQTPKVNSPFEAPASPNC